MDSSEDRILPLINIVFLLLIFFMVVGHLAPVDELVEQPLESSVAQSAQESAVTLPVMLQMGREGALALDGERISDSLLLDRLQQRFAQPQPPSGVQLKVDGRADAQAAIRLIHRLREAGIPAVNLLTLQADQPQQERT